MQTGTFTENGRQELAREPRVAPAREDPLRAQAIQRIHQLRRWKVHLVAFALGIPLLGGVWVLTEYFEEHTWPSRFASDPDVAGTWDPWFFFVAGIWAIVLVVHTLKVWFGPSVGPIGRYIHRPVTEAEVDRELKRTRR